MISRGQSARCKRARRPLPHTALVHSVVEVCVRYGVSPATGEETLHGPGPKPARAAAEPAPRPRLLSVGVDADMSEEAKTTAIYIVETRGIDARKVKSVF